MNAILTVVGKDKVGIIAAVSAALAKLDINILDINQTVMKEYFTMIMLVDIEKSNMPFDEIRKTLNSLSEEIGLEIRIQRDEIFQSMHRI
ncbi:MAG: ACT domain-containing protein [Eubacteriales bacterium]